MTKIYLFYALMGTDGNALRHTSPVGMRLLGIFSVGIHGVPLHCRLLLPSRASHSTSAEDLQTSAIVSWGGLGLGGAGTDKQHFSAAARVECGQ